MKTKNTLILGSILFQGQGVDVTQILEVYGVVVYDTLEDAETQGENYLNGGGDSYLILESFDKEIKWVGKAKEEYNYFLNKATDENYNLNLILQILTADTINKGAN